MNTIKNRVKQGKTVNLFLSGVGGQGVIIASNIITEVAMHAGFDVKKSEVHGMSQRGGSVTSQVRFGKKVFSPLIKKGSVDVLLAFEQLESIRFIENLKPEGAVIFNDLQIIPLTVYSMNIKYPNNIEELCKKITPHVFSVNATKAAEDLGNIRITNTIMLGTLSTFLEFDKELWEQVISERVPSKTIDLNKEAFAIGRSLVT